MRRGETVIGYPFRVTPQAREMLAWSQSVPETYRRCIGGRKLGERSDPVTVAIWGDSCNRPGHSASPGSCGGWHPCSRAVWLFLHACRDLRNTALKRAEYCAVHNEPVLDHRTRHPDLRLVVIFAYWNSHIEARDFNNDAGALVRDRLVAVPMDQPDDMPDAERIDALTRHFRNDLERLVAAGKPVITLGPIPEPGFDLPTGWGAISGWVSILRHIRHIPSASLPIAPRKRSPCWPSPTSCGSSWHLTIESSVKPCKALMTRESGGRARVRGHASGAAG